MTDAQNNLLIEHYSSYNNVIKPLIAAYEAREQVFPTPIFNEIRAFNDHVSRCYLEDATPDFIDRQLLKAGRHISRIILDLYKYLIISFSEKIKRFERKTRNVDLSLVNNGEFYREYSSLRSSSVVLLREAKRLEAATNSGQDDIFRKFEESFNQFQETDKLITSNFSEINWAKAKSIFKKNSWILGVLLGCIFSWIVRDILNWNFVETVCGGLEKLINRE